MCSVPHCRNTVKVHEVQMELDATVWVTVPKRTPLFGASNGTNRTDKMPEIGNLP